MKTKDNSKFHPEGHFSDNLKDMFVTGMEEDVLNENMSEQNDEKQKQQKQI